MQKLEQPVPNQYRFVIIKQLIPKHLEDVIDTNKKEYGNYDDALNYVKTQLRKHQEKGSPVPMDIGNLEQNSDEHKQERDNDNHDKRKKHGDGGLICP